MEQNPAFWPAICSILARKTMGFGAQNACFQFAISCKVNIVGQYMQVLSSCNCRLLHVEFVDECAQSIYSEVVVVEPFHLLQILHGLGFAAQSQIAQGEHILAVYLVGQV